MLTLLLKLWPLIATTVLYSGQVVILLLRRDWPNAIIFVGYALANIGLIWSLS